MSVSEGAGVTTAAQPLSIEHRGATKAKEGGVTLLERLSEFWWNEKRVRLNIGAVICLYASTWVVSYISWLAHGCILFCPWISDFSAGPSEYLFPVGFTAAAVCHASTYVDVFLATRHGNWWCFRNSVGFLQMVFGVWSCINIIGGVANPWQYQLDPHVWWMRMAFYTIFAWIVLGLAMGCQKHGIVCPLTAVALAVPLVVAMLHFNTKGLLEVGSELGRYGLPLNMDLMVSNFTQYCTAEGISQHKHFDVNLAAFLEWTFLAWTWWVVFAWNIRDLRGWPKHAVAGPSVGEEEFGESIGPQMSVAGKVDG